MLQHVRMVGRLSGVTGFAAAALALALLLWPLNAPGVRGSALTPHYRDFGWYAYVPLPKHPTLADFRRAGIPLPMDKVHRRRTTALSAAVVSAVAFAAHVVLRRRREPE